MFFWNPCCRQDGGRKSGGWFAHVDRPPSNGPSRRGQPSGRGTATWPAPMTWTLPPRQWRTRVRPSKTRADYLCEYIFSKFTPRLPRRVTAHINNGAVFAQLVPEATQRPSLLTTARTVARAILKEKCSGPKAGTASSQRTTTTQHTVPLRSILYHYAAYCTKAAMRLFAYGHAINGQNAKDMAAKDMAQKGPPGCRVPSVQASALPSSAVQASAAQASSVPSSAAQASAAQSSSRPTHTARPITRTRSANCSPVSASMGA